MTIGVEFESKILNVDGVPIRISLYDAVSAVYADVYMHFSLGVPQFPRFCALHVVLMPFSPCCAPQPGNHRFRKLSTPYYRSLACVIVVYDVTRCVVVAQARRIV